MRLTVLGRSPARPNAGEACAGYLVEGGGTRVLMDAGPGTVANLLTRWQPSDLDAVVISHMHTDHFLDLVTMRYAYPWRVEANPRLRVYIPPGSTDQMQWVARGAGYPDFFDHSYTLVEYDGIRPVEVGNLRFEPAETVHFVRTWGFRVTARGEGEDPNRILAYSADSGPCDTLLTIAEGADLFLCEAALHAVIEDAPQPEERGHLLPAEAGDYARKARVDRLVLTHLPSNSDNGAWAATEAAVSFGGPVEVAEILKTWEV
jgi:ribonuclease BN (tRNA processing enzyme)